MNTFMHCIWDFGVLIALDSRLILPRVPHSGVYMCSGECVCVCVVVVLLRRSSV